MMLELFQPSLPDLIRQSMLRPGSMDRRLKPGGDEV
jgi:hypothetical protein